MHAFSANDLNKQVRKVTDAATKAPIVITWHGKPRFVVMSYENYQRIKTATDPRRARDAAQCSRLAAGGGLAHALQQPGP